MKILQVKNVRKEFGELKALQGVNFEVNRGEIFGIAGQNGAGKTTLFNIITGHLKSSGGQVIFEDENVANLAPHRICKKGIARIFQIPCVFSSMTVFENVLIGAYFGRFPKKRNEKKVAQEVIEFVGLAGKEDVVAEHVNLRDEKLIMLAAALATGPKLLLLDEPVGGLTPVEIKYFKELVKKINKEFGITVIMIEHLMDVLSDLSDRLMILNYGEVICIGSSEEVMQNKRVKEVYLGEE